MGMQHVGFLFCVFYIFKRGKWLIFTISNGIKKKKEKKRISLTPVNKYIKIMLEGIPRCEARTLSVSVQSPFHAAW